jgi:hypothetical protein
MAQVPRPAPGSCITAPEDIVWLVMTTSLFI